jgi:RNA polymerase sigma-70 factor (ECF subfamily)
VTADTDGALVARVLDGPLDDYAVLVRRYQAGLLRYATRMLGDAAEAEDAVQEAFVRAYRSLATCAEPGRFGAWLFTILVNRCRTRAVAGRRRRSRFVPAEGAPEPAVAHPEERVAWREEIDRAVAELPPDQREAFLLKHVEEWSYDEMSDRTGVSVPALKMRVKRACDRLRDQLRGVYEAC